MDPSSYTYRANSHPPYRTSQPGRPSNSRSHSHKPPRLGAISEDSSTIQPDPSPLSPSPPQPPPRAHHRPLRRMFHLGIPPIYGSHGEKVPEYREKFHDFSDVKGPRGENFHDLRHNRHINKRGGWRRLVVIAMVGLGVVVGLGVGVGVGIGLSRRNGDSSTSTNSPTTPQTNGQDEIFPLGSYSFPTFLSTVTTSCTPTAATWSCFPYVTYNESSTGALTSFNWIISSASDDPNSSNPADYLISSSNNPWALSFANVSLRLVDPGSDTEALTFAIPAQKTVFPDADVSGDGSAARCLYNETVFEVKLYTKKGSTYPPDIGSSSGSNGDGDGTDGGGSSSSSSSSSGDKPRQEFRPWPHAVEVAQTTDAAPDCHKTRNGKSGDSIQLSGGDLAALDGECKCAYQNFGT